MLTVTVIAKTCAVLYVVKVKTSAAVANSSFLDYMTWLITHNLLYLLIVSHCDCPDKFSLEWVLHYDSCSQLLLHGVYIVIDTPVT